MQVQPAVFPVSLSVPQSASRNLCSDFFLSSSCLCGLFPLRSAKPRAGRSPKGHDPTWRRSGSCPEVDKSRGRAEARPQGCSPTLASAGPPASVMSCGLWYRDAQGTRRSHTGANRLLRNACPGFPFGSLFHNPAVSVRPVCQARIGAYPGRCFESTFEDAAEGTIGDTPDDTFESRPDGRSDRTTGASSARSPGEDSGRCRVRALEGGRGESTGRSSDRVSGSSAGGVRDGTPELPSEEASGGGSRPGNGVLTPLGDKPGKPVTNRGTESTPILCMLKPGPFRCRLQL